MIVSSFEVGTLGSYNYSSPYIEKRMDLAGGKTEACYFLIILGLRSLGVINFEKKQKIVSVVLVLEEGQQEEGMEEMCFAIAL